MPFGGQNRGLSREDTAGYFKSLRAASALCLIHLVSKYLDILRAFVIVLVDASLAL